MSLGRDGLVGRMYKSGERKYGIFRGMSGVEKHYVGYEYAVWCDGDV